MKTSSLLFPIGTLLATLLLAPISAAAAQAKWDQLLKTEPTRLSHGSLKHYDAVIFANTTGDLPIPVREGFAAWIKSGKANSPSTIPSKIR